jgi:hypothetical protein
MIYYLRALSNESDNFVFDIAIDGSARFIDLHNLIQNSLPFDRTQLTSFFITDSEWQKEKEITLIDMTGDGTLGIMDEEVLDNYLKEPHQRMLYTFDTFAERVLFIELISVEEGEMKEPTIIRLEGEPPVAESDFGLDLGGEEEEGFDLEELDGLDDLDGFADDDMSEGFGDDGSFDDDF